MKRWWYAGDVFAGLAVLMSMDSLWSRIAGSVGVAAWMRPEAALAALVFIPAAALAARRSPVARHVYGIVVCAGGLGLLWFSTQGHGQAVGLPRLVGEMALWAFLFIAGARMAIVVEDPKDVLEEAARRGW